MRAVWVFILLAGFAAGAQADDFSINFEINTLSCWDGLFGPALRIDDCTWLLKSGELREGEYADTYYYRGIGFADKGQYDRAIRDYDQAIALKPGEARAYHEKAWLLATSRRNDIRNGREAVRLARRSVAIDDGVYYLDVLAAAYAEAGQFADAVRTQARAIVRLRAAGKYDEVADLQSRLDLYRAGQPYRAN